MDTTMLHVPFGYQVRNALRRSPLRKLRNAYHHRRLTPKDVLLAGYPRSGSTWMAFMLVELLWCPGKQHSLRDSRYCAGMVWDTKPCCHYLPSGGRLIRTHERYNSAYKRAICIARDPRDAAVSQYFHVQRTLGVRGSFSEFLPFFLRGTFSGAGPWNGHVKSWLDSPAMASSHVLWIRYEDLQIDAAKEVRRAAKFLRFNATDSDVERAVEAGRFDVMRARETTTEGMVHRENGQAIAAIRKGAVGDWKNHFTTEDLKLVIDQLGPTALRAGYQLDDDLPPKASPTEPAAAATLRMTELSGKRSLGAVAT